MTKRLAWGLFFIISAVAVLAGAMGLIPEISFFKLLVTVLCIAIMVASIKDLSWPGILFPIAVLCIVYDDMLGIEVLTPGPVLAAALLGSIGLSMIFRPKKEISHNAGTSQFVDSGENVYGNSINMSTTFGGSTKYINTDEFENATISCTFGAMKVYFDNATMKTGEAVVDLDVSFAGVELYVPRTWSVNSNVKAAFGGVEQRNCSNGDLGPMLRLTGEVNFGGVKVIYI